jgi:hypothetical protein
MKDARLSKLEIIFYIEKGLVKLSRMLPVLP